MKKFYLILAFICLAAATNAQLRVAIMGGPHSATVHEKNSIPDWETNIKPGYSPRRGMHLGALLEVPVKSAAPGWYFQPGIQFMSKGRRFLQYNDSLASILSDTMSTASNLSVNYVDIPLSIAYKYPIGKRAKLFVSAGPYIGFFFNGKQHLETKLYSINAFKTEEVTLETGADEGKVKTFDIGLQGRAGFEIGNLMLSGFLSQGLTNFYTAQYDAKFRHSVRGLTVGIWLNPVKKAKAKPGDRDKDGIADSVDACPTVAGLEALDGCPDADNDGVADAKDKCPNQAGTAKNDGCPVPDTDGDGVDDESDECPGVVGVLRYKGCPIPDSDGDGVNDEADSCVNEAGTVDNKGCPEKKSDTLASETREQLDAAARNIFFEASSDRLAEASYKALDNIATILKNTTYNVFIEGHTDSSGDPAKNRLLSQKRAEAVKNYLIRKGVGSTRLYANGLGSDLPIAPNSTPEGRARNRRVEITLGK